MRLLLANKNHTLLFSLSLLFAFILIIPSILIPVYRNFYARHYPQYKDSWPNNGSFSHFAMFGGDGKDACLYGARAKQVANHGLPLDPFLKDATTPALLTRDSLGFVFLGLLQRITGNLELTWVLARLIVIPFYFLLGYRILTRAGAPSRSAIFWSGVMTLFWDVLIELPGNGGPIDFMKSAARRTFWLLGGEQAFFGPTRLMNPAVCYPPLLLASLLTVLAAASSEIWAAILGGVVGGLLAYVHTNVWVVYNEAAALFFLSLSIRGRRLHRTTAFALMASGVVSFPWFALNLPFPPDLILRTLVFFGRHFSWLSLVYLLAAAVQYRTAGNNPMLEWLACGMAAAFLMLNASIVTGYRIMDFYWIPIGNLFLFLAAASALSRRLEGGGAWLWLTAIAAVLCVGREIGYSAQVFKTYAIPRDYEEAFAWLNRNTAADSVVVALSGEINTILPVHTRDKTMIAPTHIVVSDVSVAENARRLSFAVSLLIPPNRRADALRRLLSVPSSHLETDQQWQGKIDRDELEKYPMESYFTNMGQSQSGNLILAEMTRVLHEPLQKRYAADYLWAGKLEKTLQGPSGRPNSNLEKVYENPAVTLYRIRKTQALGKSYFGAPGGHEPSGA